MYPKSFLTPNRFAVDRCRMYSFHSSRNDFITRLGLRRMPLDFPDGTQIAWHEVGSPDREHDLALTGITIDETIGRRHREVVPLASHRR